MTRRCLSLMVAAWVLGTGVARGQAWTTPKTWATSELVTAAMLNAHIRDNELILKTSINDDGTLKSTSSVTDATTTNASFLDFHSAAGRVLIGLLSSTAAIDGTTFGVQAYDTIINTKAYLDGKYGMSLRLATNNTIRMTIKGGSVLPGYVGIGTTAPDELLHISHQAGTGGPNIKIDGNLTDGSTYLGGVLYSLAGVDIAGVRVKEHSADTYGLEFQVFGAALATKATLLGTGQFGLGTTAPAAQLEVRVASGQNGVRLSDAGGIIATLNGAGGDGAAEFNLNTAGGTSAISLNAASNSFVSGGNFGVNQTSPTYQLDVSGTVRLANVSTASAGQTYSMCMNASNEVIRTDTVNWCVTSSAKYKQDITPLADGLATVLRLRPSRFFYRPAFNGPAQSNPNFAGEQVGFIAEHVAAVDPRLVTVDPRDGSPASVRYMQLTATLTRAIQEQQAQIAGLQARVRAVEGRKGSR